MKPDFKRCAKTIARLILTFVAGNIFLSSFLENIKLDICNELSACRQITGNIKPQVSKLETRFHIIVCCKVLDGALSINVID